MPVARSTATCVPSAKGKRRLPDESCWRGVLAAASRMVRGGDVRVVANREPALRVEGTLGDDRETLFQSWGGLGAHEVVIESPTIEPPWRR